MVDISSKGAAFTCYADDGCPYPGQYTNPHAWLQLEAADANGKPVEWSIEMGGINSLARGGYRPSTFKPGDPVSVYLAPHMDGVPAGLYIGARLNDGTVLGKMP